MLTSANQLGLFLSLCLWVLPLRIFQIGLLATTLVVFAPARRVKDAIGTHYSNLVFASVRGT